MGKWSAFCRAIPLFLIFLLPVGASAVDWGGKPSGQPVAPHLPSAPGASPMGGPQCVMDSISPAAAEVNDEVTIGGVGLGNNCSVYFQNAAGQSLEAVTQSIEAGRLKVWVPVMVSGRGTVATRLKGVRIEKFDDVAKSLPFEIKPSLPHLTTVSPASAVVGEKITVTGSNFRAGEPWAAYFVSDKAKRIQTSIEWINATTFRVVVPDMEKAQGVQDSGTNRNHFYVTRGNVASNHLYVPALPAAQCLIKTVSPATQYVRDHVYITGDYMSDKCEAVFYTSGGQGFPAQSWSVYGDPGLWATVPEMQSGKGTVSARLKGEQVGKAAVPFETKPIVPLLAKRTDVFMPAFGAKIMNGDMKNYKPLAPSSTTFECMIGWSVYRENDVYTYMYDLLAPMDRIEWISAYMPDRDNPSLKYGVVEYYSKMQQGNGKWVTHDGKLNMVVSFLPSTSDQKNLTVYVQSKKTPVAGTVAMGGGQGRTCRANDAMVPQR